MSLSWHEIGRTFQHVNHPTRLDESRDTVRTTMKTAITFSQICDILAVAAAKDHDMIVVSPAGMKTRLVYSARGLGHAATEPGEIPAPFVVIGIDVKAALETKGWNVVKTSRGFTATRRASAMSMVREAA